MRPGLLPLLFLLLPFAEIAGFVVVGRQIGVLGTIGLVVLSSVVGLVLLRLQGLGIVRRIQAEIEAGRDPGRQLVHGLLIVLAGVLLLIPGFVTDIVGLLLFLPPVRDLAWRLLRGRIGVVAGFTRPGFPPRRPPGGPVVDLGEGEFSRTRDPDSPWRRIDGDR